MKYFFIAGEASGDLHASNLIQSLKKIDTDFEAIGWGGDRMKKEGVKISKHIKDLAFMGFYEVAKNLKTILNNLKNCKEEIISYQPEAVILVDYPGFNLKIAKFCKQNSIPVYYYVSPTVWAWKKSRVFTIRDNVEQLYCILPFEKDFYAKYGIEVSYEGHPLLDEIEVNSSKGLIYEEVPESKNLTIALLPGSRMQELKTTLPLLLRISESYPDLNFILGAAPGIDKKVYKKYLQGSKIKISYNGTQDLLKQSDMAIVTSGTATLETALLNIPQIVIYKTSLLSYWIGSLLLNIKYISLVNLIMDKEVVPELIQGNLNFENLSKHLENMIHDPSTKKEMLMDYAILHNKVGKPGVNQRIAQSIYDKMTVK